MQELIIIALFIIAVFSVARKIYLDFSAKSGCPKGCGACEVSKKAIQ